ncbi:hypothetical protein CTA2_11963 [Colletotrichum tanaceti]|uniref:Uncharacterized protein n=1 Tax=Colletotrichum tanaceti TaxID=1306861 RepID=A0A4U6XLZ7_9PEZI|nr:hypothetical protein CTA2_11963 [Colletotrichum tanaceti]TKW56685.1 hypothetical protein CTA1_1540 [Colletotrichum tanaceti]
MVRIQHSPRPAKTSPSLFSDFLSKDITTESVPGRTRHFGLMKPPSNATSITPSDTQMLDLQRRPYWALQRHAGDAPTSPSSASTTNEPSAATSQSGFDGYTDVCHTQDQPPSRDLPPGVPTGPAADRKRHNQLAHLSGNLGNGDNRPPLDAPTGPAAQRKQVPKPIATQGSQQLTRPAESASWSQSLTWQSDRARARESFRKMSVEMRHLGIDQSPAAPKDFNEYLTTRMHNVQRGLALHKRQQQRAGEQQHHSKTAEEHDPTQPPRPEATLHHSLTSDKLSPLFGADLCWNAHYTRMDRVPHSERVEWPPLSAFKEAGRRRIGPDDTGRLLPLPRQNRPREPVRMIEGDCANDERDTVDYRQKVIKLDRLSLSPPHSLLELDTSTTCEVDVECLPAWTRKIIDEIVLNEEDDMATTQEGDGNKEKKCDVEREEE